MDRKGIIAVALAIVVLVTWQINYSKEMAKYQEAKRLADAAAAVKATPPPEALNAAPGDATQAGQPAAQLAPEAPPSTPEELQKLASPSVEYTFTNLGGGISAVTLLKHVVAYGSDEKVVLNAFGKTPIGAVGEHADGNTWLPYTAQVDQPGGKISYERTDASALKTVKTYTVPKSDSGPGEYTIGLDLTYTNTGEKSLEAPGYFLQSGSAYPIHRADVSTYTGVDWYAGSNTFKAVSSFSSGGIFGFNKSDEPSFVKAVSNLDWTGVTDQYFCTIVTPAKTKGVGVWGHKFAIEPVQNSELAHGPASKGPILAVQGALQMPAATLAPGQSVSEHFDIYTGPREYQRLKALGGDQQEIMDFGTFKVVSQVLLNSMNWLHGILGSYAAAIIVLTLIIRTLMWPLQNKATEAGKKMQALGPKMNELKEKYKDDPQRVSEETMKLYKEYGINPVSGCVPSMLQIPIFFGLFRMLGKAVELRNSHFLWVHDLSQPDTIATIAGYPINILPLCMAATMFAQMQLSPKTGDATQQRTFMFMPLIFVIFCYNYASALALYWTVQNIFTIGQLYITRNRTTPILQRIASASKKKGRAR